MKNIINKTTVILFFLLLPQFLYSAINQKILVKVDNEIISSYELKNNIKKILVMSNKKLNQNNIDMTKKIALTNLIDLKLKKIQVDKFKVELDQNVFTNKLNEISSSNILALKEKFLINNINYEIFEKELAIELRWQKLIFLKFKELINIEESEIDHQVNKILVNQKDIVEYKLLEFEVFSEIDKKKIESIQNIKKEINSFGLEETLNKFKINYSRIEKNELGWINSNVLSKSILNIVKKLKIGETSTPINSSQNILFIKLVDKKNIGKENLNIKKLKDQIINKRQNELFELYSRSFLSQIKNNSLIEYK